MGSLTEATSFTVFSVCCGADIILGYNWLKAHDLQFLYDDSQISVCPAGDRSGKWVWADLATAADPAAAAAASLMQPNKVIVVGSPGMGYFNPVGLSTQMAVAGA